MPESGERDAECGTSGAQTGSTGRVGVTKSDAGTIERTIESWVTLQISCTVKNPVAYQVSSSGRTGDRSSHECLNLRLGAGKIPYPDFIYKTKELLPAGGGGMIPNIGNQVILQNISGTWHGTIQFTIQIKLQGSAIIYHRRMPKGAGIPGANLWGGKETGLCLVLLR